MALLSRSFRFWRTKGFLPVDKSLKILSDKARLAFLPLDNYDIDMDLARSFPAETCQRWCVLPFDRMSKSILVATANPFNQQAAKELAGGHPQPAAVVSGAAR